MLISQRLAGGKSMAATVKDFIADRPTFCPDNRRLDEQTLSSKSSAYAGARERLGLPTAKHLFDRVVESITHPKVAFGVRPRQTFILDDTTITLSPTEQLRSEFPLATNQHGESVWPIMLMFVAHDLETGCACVDRFEEALRCASKAKIPHRPGRNYKRTAHPRRPKTTKWQKAQRQGSDVNSNPEQIPPDPPK